MTNPILINKLTFWRRLDLVRGRKKRNKHLLIRLADWNLQLQPAGQLPQTFNLTTEDLAFLAQLGQLENGWHSFEFSPAPVLGNHDRLAALGLIFLAWPIKKISLSDAGRFLLVLAALKPA